MTNRRRSAIKRSTDGNLLAEMPAGLYLLFIGIGLPMLVLASMFTRSFLLYQATIDSCKQAARSSTYTAANAKALSVFAANSAAWTGVSGTPTFSIMRKRLTGSATTAPTIYTAPLPASAISVSQNVYLARVVVQGQIDPLFPIGNTWAGMSIPGLTKAYPLTLTYVFYFENPSGLSS